MVFERCICESKKVVTERDILRFLENYIESRYLHALTL